LDAATGAIARKPDNNKENRLMNATTLTTARCAATFALATCAAALLLLCGCHNAVSGAEKPAATSSDEKPGGAGASDPEAKGKADAQEKSKTETKDQGEGKNEAAAGEGPEEGVSLKPEEVEKLGIATTKARAIMSEPEAPGFGVVVAHETIAQMVAELRTAIAAARQSHSAFERSKRLSGTPGAMPADTQETAERQAAADQAALELARQRLSSTFGQSPPWKNADSSPELLVLASGQAKLVRTTFPLGSLDEVTPSSLRFAHINASNSTKSCHQRRQILVLYRGEAQHLRAHGVRSEQADTGGLLREGGPVRRRQDRDRSCRSAPGARAEPQYRR
jgi:hypothetical protein